MQTYPLPPLFADLIQKLISNGNRLVAVKFSYEFEKTDIFPLVPILKEHRQETRKLSTKFRKGGKSSIQSLVISHHILCFIHYVSQH